MKDEEVLEVQFDPNYSDRKTPRNVIHISRSLDNSEELLLQFDYDGREDDFVYMTVNIVDLMLALGRIFKRDKIE
jgi:hypothetical protein